MALIGLFEIFLAIACFIILNYLSNKDGLERRWPLVGALPELLLRVHRIHDCCTDVLQMERCNFFFKGPWFANMDILVTADPANINYIMSTNFSNFPKGSEFKEMFDILGDGIFNSDFDSWRNQRKVAHTLVNHQLFKKFSAKIARDKVKDGLIPILEHVSKQGVVVDLQDLFQRLTFDATCMNVAGQDPRCLSIELPEVAFSKAMDKAMEAIFYRHVVPKSIWKLQRWLAIGEEKKLNEASGTLNQVTAEIILVKKKEFQERRSMKEDEEGMDLLEFYMREDGIAEEPKLSDKFLRDVILNFLLAGRDTTSSALSWFFWLVSRNPRVEEKIREELKATLSLKESGKFRLFDIEEVKGLACLHGALCETLRLYPPVPFEHKASLKPDTLPSGHHVNPKIKILISLYAMGRIKTIWGKDCLEFKPERWISERGKIKREPSYKFFAFSAGPRTCLGKEVAFTQLKVVAAAIIYNYHFQVVDGQTISPSLSVILHMKHGLKVKFAKRWA